MKKNDHRYITDILALLVFGIFALCVTALLLTGAGAYKKLTDRGRESYEQRIAVRYLTTRFRQASSVQIEDYSGLQVMTIREEIGGRAYVTRVYCHDGNIRELFAAESAAVSPGDGEIILPMDGLTFAVDGDVLTVDIVHPDGEIQQLFLWIPEWKEAVP